MFRACLYVCRAQRVAVIPCLSACVCEALAMKPKLKPGPPRLTDFLCSTKAERAVARIDPVFLLGCVYATRWHSLFTPT